jgi:transcriptional regulator GlxA family with amidase domain
VAEPVLQTLLEQLFALFCFIAGFPEKDSLFRNSLTMIYPQLTNSMPVEDLQRTTYFLQNLIGLLTSAAEASPPPSAQEKRILKIQEYMKENYTKDIRLADIAGYIGLSEKALCRFFKTHTSQTLLACLNEIRIEASAQMLRETDDPISGIAYTCGFNTVSHFNKVFKQRKRMTPMEYRGTKNSLSSH